MGQFGDLPGIPTVVWLTTPIYRTGEFLVEQGLKSLVRTHFEHKPIL